MDEGDNKPGQNVDSVTGQAGPPRMLLGGAAWLVAGGVWVAVVTTFTLSPLLSIFWPHRGDQSAFEADPAIAIVLGVITATLTMPVSLLVTVVGTWFWRRWAYRRQNRRSIRGGEQIRKADEVGR